MGGSTTKQTVDKATPTTSKSMFRIAKFIEDILGKKYDAKKLASGDRPIEAHQPLDVVDGAGGCNASGALRHKKRTSDDYFELVVQEAERVGAAAGGSPSKNFEDAMQFHLELHERELRWQKERKDKELLKERLECLRSMVPGLN